MTETSISYLTAPLPPRRRLQLNEIVAWGVIVASVLFVAGNYFLRSRLAPVNTTRITPPVGQLLITARYAVGAKLILPTAAEPTTKPTNSAAVGNLYLTQAEHYAKTTTDRLRVVPVVGELLGREAALKRLDALRSELEGTPLAADAESLRVIYEQSAVALAPTARDALIDHHDWFGALAVSFQRPPTDPLRQQVLRQAKRTALAILGIGAAGLVGFGIGLILILLGIIYLTERRIVFAYRPEAGEDTVPFLEGFAIFMAGYVALGLLGRYIDSIARFETVRWLLSCAPIALALVWPRLRGVPMPAWRWGLGWHTGRGLFREIISGWAGYLGGLPLLAVGMMITFFLVRRSGVDAMHPIINEATGTASSAIRLYFLAAIWAPLIEESLFRGLLFHHLRSSHGWWISAVISSLLFAGLHPQGWVGLPVLISIALVLAGIREWRGSIFASAAAHAMNNAAVTTMLVIATS